MILRPLVPHSRPESNRQSAWQVISQTQNIEAPQYLLIGQPDHARLSGELASRFRAEFLPPIDAEVEKAISVHDDGWAQFPCEKNLRGEPLFASSGRPRHFMQVPVEQSLMAWKGSIESAGKISALAKFMVSGHFSRIGRMGIEMHEDSPEDIARLEQFVREEEELQGKLEGQLKLSSDSLSEYVDLLQFCDLLSLYLCCGSTDPVEFPQRFGGERVKIDYEDGVFSTRPSLFANKAERFSLPVRVYPTATGQGHTRFGLHVR